MSEDIPAIKEEKKPDVKEVKVIRMEGDIDFYASNIQIGFTFFEFRLACGQVVEAESEPAFHSRVTLLLSPQHAKALLPALETSIRKYETRFGAIPTLPATEMVFEVKGSKEAEKPDS